MDNQPKHRSLSFALYVAGAFALIAAATVVIMSSVMAITAHIRLGASLAAIDLSTPILIAAIISLVISGAIGIFFANSISGPISRISKTADAIKEGDMSARTGLKGDDEISRLAMNFDEMADSIERDRDLERQLIGDVAHELRTPLMAIQATVEAIQDGVFEADEQRLSTLSSETRRLGRLVEGLLKLNRLETGATQAAQEPINLSEVLSSLVISHQALVEDASITLSSNITEDVHVVGNADLIQQATANLLSNAVRYTPEGGSIRVSLTRERGSACIAVTDTGIGISEENLKKVFSRFWRADEARNQSSGGLGIGLSLVKEIADQHRGMLQVESTLGEGSTFFIYIPLSYNDPVVVASMSKSDKRRAEKTTKREQERQRKELDKKNRQAAKAAAAQARREKQMQREQEKREQAKREQERREQAKKQQQKTGDVHVAQQQRRHVSDTVKEVTEIIFKRGVPLVPKKKKTDSSSNDKNIK